MKITPLDIQHKEFGSQIRGYNRQQVDQFLEEIADTVETYIRDNSALKEKLSAHEEELIQLKQSESALTNTLVSTQSFVDHLKRGAQRDADLIVKEAELKAEEILAHSRTELVELRRMVSDLRRHRALVLERMRATLNAFHRLIEVEDSTENPEEFGVETDLTSDRNNVPDV